MKTIEILNDLIQLDYDAVKAYGRAIDKISDPSIAREISSFQRDHERHVEELTQAVRQLGGEPTEKSRDVKGVLLEGFTALRSVTGTEGALKAMRSNEKTTNEKYDEALTEPLPEDIAVLVRSNRDDERRHLLYIEDALTNRIWEQREERRSDTHPRL